MGTTGDHQTAAENINLPPAGAGSVQARRPYPRFGNLSVQTQAQSSDYQALQIKLQQRPARGLWYLVSYTYSESTRRVPAPEIGGNYTYETQPQPWDIPHLFSASYGYELPFGKGRKFLSNAGGVTNAIVGGWQFQNIISYRSGLPYTPTISRDVANIGVGGQRPNRVGSGELENPTIDVWFDKTAFVVPASFTLRRLGPGHPALGSPVERRHVAVQAIRDPQRPDVRVPSRGVQRAELDVLQCAEHEHRYGGGWTSDEYVEPGTADSVRVQVRVLGRGTEHRRRRCCSDRWLASFPRSVAWLPALGRKLQRLP